MSRSIWVLAGVGAVLLLAVINTQGNQNQSFRAEDPLAQAELKLLRDRVASLEAKLGAQMVDVAQSSRTQTMFSSEGQALQRPASLNGRRHGQTFAPKQQVSSIAAAPVPVEARVVESQLSETAAQLERNAPPVPQQVVPLASWWSDMETRTSSGAWCRKAPPYASIKPALPIVEPGDDKPQLTTELAKKHASTDNLLIATYVNFNRLDFAYTFVKHLVALRNPHFLVGAMDEKALRGLQSHGIQSFLIDSGLTTNDYGWGTYAFRQLGLHKVQLVLNLARTGVNCITVDADAFILRDPFPYIRQIPRADVLMSSDHLVASNGYSDTGLFGGLNGILPAHPSL